LNNNEQPLHKIPVTTLKGVGPKSAERLAKIGIESIQDLLFHLPSRYEDRTRIVPLSKARPGDHIVVEGSVKSTQIKFGRRRSLQVTIDDGTGILALRFFHFTAAQKNAMAKGVVLRCFGEIRNGPQCYEIAHPEYQITKVGRPLEVPDCLTPIYPTTDGMHQLTWRDLTEKALALMETNVSALQELIPVGLTNKNMMLDLGDAVRFIHRPSTDVSLYDLAEGKHPAQQRLVFEELLAHQLSMQSMRESQRVVPANALKDSPSSRKALLDSLGFELTDAQARVLKEISADLKQDEAMLRMVQGDVGSGKTIVAALAALQALANGYQVAMMAPTELLAEQHVKNFSQWLAPLGVETAWLSGQVKGKKRKETLAAIKNGQAKMIVGTHALFQNEVIFQNLALVVIDEQHRFGVNQRLALRDKGIENGRMPHQLIMTATPIPRSLAMTAYGDLDLSIIDELPPGRKPISTVVISNDRREEVISRVAQACTTGRQAYWVCTLIEESEALQCEAAEVTAAYLTENLSEVKVGLVHGRMKSSEKERVMASFKAGDLDVLVATTVIEVGVDVPNASLMIIENPERLGLSQLHQLRGRVGRGTEASHCVLMYNSPLGKVARERLGILRETNDGFVIAQKDLEIRGAGEVLGTRQTGEMQFRLADLIRDEALLDDVKSAAKTIMMKHQNSITPLIHRWIGEKVNYARV